MNKYSVDFASLDKKLSRPKAYKLADVQPYLEKVAFDVVRFRDNEDTDQLWKIENSAEGPIIVAMYEQLEPKIASVNTEWSAITDTDNNINIFYKEEPITRIASRKMNISGEDASLMCRWIPKKLASDAEFRNSLLKDMSDESRDLLLSKYPEILG